jgi:hypothetical protein
VVADTANARTVEAMKTSRRPRTVIAAAAALALACIVTLLPASPAAAIEIIPVPSGEWTGLTGSSVGGGSMSMYCEGGAYRWRKPNGESGLMHLNGPNCKEWWEGGGAADYWDWQLVSSATMTCVHAFEVWRFTGTVANPTQVRTVSRINNLDPNCAQFASNPTIHRNMVTEWNPEDDIGFAYGVAVGLGGIFAPYRVARDTNLAYTNMERSYTFLPAPGTFYGIAPVATTNYPFRRDGGDCSRFQTRDPDQRKYFEGGESYTPNTANSLTSETRRRYEQIRDNYGSSFADMWADSSGVDGNGVPRSGDNGIPCSGPFDFSVPINPAYENNMTRQPDVRVSGYCYTPLRARFLQYRHRSAGLGMIVPVADGYRPNFNQQSWGVPEQYVAPAERNGNTGAIINSYRASLRDEVLSRAPGTTPYPAINGETPRSSSNEGGASAAWAASDNSNCAFAYGNRHTSGGSNSGRPVEELPGDAVRLEVHVPDAGQVGGKNRDAAQITTRLAQNPIRCGDTACSVSATNGPWINWNGSTAGGLPAPWAATELKGAVDARVALTPPPGMTEGSVSGDWSTRQAYTPATRGTTAGQGTWGLEFFRATAAGEPYQVTGSGQATIWGWVGSESWTDLCRPAYLGGGCDRVTTTTRTRVDRQVPLEVVYPNGQTFPVVGPTATPTETRQNRD